MTLFIILCPPLVILMQKVDYRDKLRQRLRETRELNRNLCCNPKQNGHLEKEKLDSSKPNTRLSCGFVCSIRKTVIYFLIV